MGGRRVNRCFTGISVGIMALMIAACAESSVGGLPNPSGNAATRMGGAESAASADSIIRLAEASRAAGDRVTAISLYHRAALAAPEDAAVQIKIGFILHELGAFAEADGSFRRALVVAPRNADALRGLGITLVARDMPHHAIEKLEAAIEAGADPRAYNALGVARDMTGDRAAARQAYGAGLERDPENLTLLNNLGLSLALSGRFDEAISVLGRVTASPNATPRHRQNLALAYGLAGRPDLAADVSNNDLAMRDVASNLGYYAWLRNRPVGESGLGENSLRAALSAPVTVPRAGAMTAAAADGVKIGATTGAMTDDNAPPRALVAAPTVNVKEGASKEFIAPPLPITPLARPTTGVQTADTTDSGMNSGANSGAGDTVWQLTDIVDETPVKDAPKTPAVKTPPADDSTMVENEGVNAAFEAAAGDPPIAAETAASDTDKPGARLPDAIADAIISAPASAPAENNAAAFDGSAYSRHLESTPESAIADAPVDDEPMAAETDADVAPSADTAATDMTAADWAVANRAEAASVAAPSAQFAMAPEDTTLEDTASDVPSDMIAAADSDFESDHDSIDVSATTAPDDTGGGRPVPEADDTAADYTAGDDTAADKAADAAESDTGADATEPMITPSVTPTDATEHMDAPAATPADTPTEVARAEPRAAEADDSATAGPATASADTGRNGDAPAIDQSAEPGDRVATAFPYAEPPREPLARNPRFAAPPDTGTPRAPAIDRLAEPGDRVATAYPYAEPPRERLAQNPRFAAPPDAGTPSAPTRPTRLSILAGASMNNAAAAPESGPNVVMLAALGATMFLIMAMLALGRLRRRTGEPEPE